MKIKLTIVGFFLITLVINSCTDKESGLNFSTCATVKCAPPSQTFKLKFLDKTTEVDLIFGNIIIQAKYKLSDVSVYSTRFKKNLTFEVDSANKTNKFLFFSTLVTDEFIISLANQPTDKLIVETQFIDQPCCDELKLTKLTLNASAMPFTQFTPTIIILKK